jgi:hypothetical protein
MGMRKKREAATKAGLRLFVFSECERHSEKSIPYTHAFMQYDSIFALEYVFGGSEGGA